MEKQPIKPRGSQPENPHELFNVHECDDLIELASRWFEADLATILPQLTDCRIYRVSGNQGIVHSGPLRVRLYTEEDCTATPPTKITEVQVYPARTADSADAEALEYHAVANTVQAILPEGYWPGFRF